MRSERISLLLPLHLSVRHRRGLLKPKGGSLIRMVRLSSRLKHLQSHRSILGKLLLLAKVSLTLLKLSLLILAIAKSRSQENEVYPMAPKKPILTFAPASRNGMNWMTHLLLACLTALLCILSPPVFAHLSQGIVIAQGLPVASQLGQKGREHYEAGQFAAAAKSWQQAAQAYQSQGSPLNQAMVLNNLALAN